MITRTNIKDSQSTAKLNIGAFSASTSLAPYLHQLSLLLSDFDCAFFWCYLGQICIKFNAIFLQKQHLLIVLFGTNFVRNINTKALKKTYLVPDQYLFLMQKKGKFNAYFSWVHLLCAFKSMQPVWNIFCYYYYLKTYCSI